MFIYAICIIYISKILYVIYYFYILYIIYTALWVVETKKNLGRTK